MDKENELSLKLILFSILSLFSEIDYLDCKATDWAIDSSSYLLLLNLIRSWYNTERQFKSEEQMS